MKTFRRSASVAPAGVRYKHSKYPNYLDAPKVAVRFDEPMFVEIRDLAEENNVSFAAVVRALVREALGKNGIDPEAVG